MIVKSEFRINTDVLQHLNEVQKENARALGIKLAEHFDFEKHETENPMEQQYKMELFVVTRSQWEAYCINLRIVIANSFSKKLADEVKQLLFSVGALGGKEQLKNI